METTAIIAQGVFALIGAVGSGVIAYVGYRIQKREKIRDEELKRLEEREEQQEQEFQAMIGALNDGMQAILRDLIYKACKDCEASGHATIYEAQHLENMYKAYHALGGNGAITQIYDNFKDLPIR